MTDPADRRPTLVNLSAQPLELHRADGVIVLAPGGHAPLRDSDRALPQLRVLLARRRVAIRDEPAEPDPPRATPSSAGRRRGRASPVPAPAEPAPAAPTGATSPSETSSRKADA